MISFVVWKLRISVEWAGNEGEEGAGVERPGARPSVARPATNRPTRPAKPSGPKAIHVTQVDKSKGDTEEDKPKRKRKRP